MLDIVYAFQNYQGLLPPVSRSVSKRMGMFLVELCYGMKDQPLHGAASDERLVTIMTAEHEELTQTQQEYDEHHRNSSGKFLESLGIERLMKSLDLYQYGEL